MCLVSLRLGGEVEIQVLHVREGRVIAADDYSFSKVQLADADVMSSFLGQYYGKKEGRSAPREIVGSVAFDDGGGLEELLRDRASHPVQIKTPQRGGAKRMVEIATRNAQLGLDQRLIARESVEAAMEEVRSECALSRMPNRIECYDVSNLQGTLAVASRVVFEGGVPIKSAYREISDQGGPSGDDYACLREVMARRLARVESEALPDLLMVDGGRGQLGVVTAALGDVGLTVDTLGISKERDVESPSPRVKRSGGLKAERLFKPGRANAILLSKSSRGLLLLQRVRDESHRFAIEYQRDLRSKFGLTSILEELPGIGAVKRRALLKELGSLRAVREASEAQLAKVSGVSGKDAARIHEFFARVAETAGGPAPLRPGDAGKGSGGEDSRG